MLETPSSDELKALAKDLLETEKKFLLEDKQQYVAAVAVVVTPESRYWEEVEFNNADEKVAAYASVVQRARENGAIAIITLNSSYERTVSDDNELVDYRWGDLQASESQRAITVTISGPKIASCSMSLPFVFEKDFVVLGEPTEFEPALINLSPDWP